jgi:hypothetical protein
MARVRAWVRRPTDMSLNTHRGAVRSGTESPESRSDQAPLAASTPRVWARASLCLRAGEWVEVRSLSEILETLDSGTGAMGGLPFMPEMVQFCGQKFRVYKSAHKTCDTIDQYVIRRMDSAVHLEGLRCDGTAHGDCQAACLIFWKEAWLKRTDGPPTDAIADGSPSSQLRPVATAGPQTECDALHRASRVTDDRTDGDERYRCQATELLEATTELRRRDRWNPLFYLKDLTSGNVTLRDFVWYGSLAVVNAFTYRWRQKRYPHLCGLAGRHTPTEDKHVQGGELVRVRSRSDIMQTLSSGLRNRGLSFDVEMVPYCGTGPVRVLRRVERIVDEKTGRLVRLPNACLILDGVTCGGKLSMHRMFCPRSIYPYWREIWLERVHQPVADASRGNDPPRRRLTS